MSDYKSTDSRCGQRWSKAEDDQLRDYMKACKGLQLQDFEEIAHQLRRTSLQCQNRWEYVIKAGLTKGPWTEEEDDIIRECVSNGIVKWSEVAKHIPGRIGKQCRERWANHLDPRLKKGEWSADEDNKLMELQHMYGNSWIKISSCMEGRSENDVKNRWNSADRRRKHLTAVNVENRSDDVFASIQEEIYVDLPETESVELCVRLADLYLNCLKATLEKNGYSTSTRNHQNENNDRMHEEDGRLKLFVETSKAKLYKMDSSTENSQSAITENSASIFSSRSVTSESLESAVGMIVETEIPDDDMASWWWGDMNHDDEEEWIHSEELDNTKPVPISKIAQG